MVGRICEKGRC